MADNDKEQKDAKPQFAIQRLYMKDISLESPKAPEIFRQKDWNPDVDIELNTKAEKLADGVHEVTLHITMTAKHEDKTAFLIEVQQAGIFVIDGLSGEALKQALGSFCPNILFPYAREAITDLIQKAGFPPFYLAPVNFDALYAQHQSKKQKTTEATGETASMH